jgi:hypothetical protein
VAEDRRNFLNETSLWRKLLVIAIFSPAALALFQTGLTTTFNHSALKNDSVIHTLGHNVGRNYSWLAAKTIGAVWDFGTGVVGGAFSLFTDKPEPPQP